MIPETHIPKESYQCYECDNPFLDDTLSKLFCKKCIQEYYLKERDLDSDRSIIFEIKGKPVPQPRHRMTWRKGSPPFAYDPGKENKIDFLLQAKQYAPKKPYEGPVYLKVVLRLPRPKKHYRTGKYAHILKSDAPKWHTSHGDWDNFGKFISDALNGVFWKDDRQIAMAEVQKIYHNDVSTLIHIMEL